MRLLIEALRRRQWKLNLSFMLYTSSALRCGPKKLDRTPLAVDLRAAAEDGEAGGYTVIREGEADILIPSSNSVFYNKAQVNNRDMSIAVLKTFISKYKEEDAAMPNIRDRFDNEMHRGTCVCPIIWDPNATEGTNENEDCKKRKNLQCNCSYKDCSNKKQEIMAGKCQGELKIPVVLEALAASGLRAIRYAREVDGIGQVVAIDNDKASFEVCMKNIQLNGPATCSKVAALLGDARVYMLTHPKEFDVVDLDPYGSPSIFLDSAVQAVADGGLLMCTATDLAVLCGDNGDVCYSKYGSYPLKGKYCHEMALRILLACIESHANRYKRFIVPILSVYMDFYIRVFVRIYTSPIAMKKTPLKLAYVYQCVGCDSFYLQSIGRAISTKNKAERYAPAFGPVVSQACSDCGQNFNVGGPIWSAPIHDQAWVESILEDVETMKESYPAYDRISSVLTAISEELHDAPLFLNLHSLCGTLKCTTPSSVSFQSIVMNAGFRISGTHTSPLGFKSDAPMHVIWDIMRCWVKSHPLKCPHAGEPGATILSKEPNLLVNFTQVSSAIRETRAKKALRFRPNPERGYGPKPRAGRRIKTKHRSLFGQETIEEVVSREDEERILNPDQ